MTGSAGPAPEPAGRPDAYGDGRAVSRERARIALELHDTVAHHMSLTVVRAEAALRNVPDLPEAAKQALEAVRDAGRAALTDTRRIVGLLRADDAGTGQPGLDRLGELVGAARGSGLLVSSAVVGAPRPLGSCVDLAAFRIVQESLSNAVRYAPGACVSVEIRYGPGAVTVSVADDGARTASTDPPGGGHGLAGMRERAGMLGGTVQAGPQAKAGWSVVAELPYAAPGSGGGHPAPDRGRTVVPLRPDGRPHGRGRAGHRDRAPAVRVVLAEGLALLRDGLVPDLPVLMLSQHVEQFSARELLSCGGGVGYLLKDRVSDVGQFVDAVRRGWPPVAPCSIRTWSPSCCAAMPAMSRCGF